MDRERLVLGTAQFGLCYGIANAAGRVGVDATAAILKCASEHGIATLDTAVAYGESESRLGSIGLSHWAVNSKLPPLPDDCPDVEQWVQRQVAGSLQRLGVEQLNGMLLHRPDQLLGRRGEALYKALTGLKTRGSAKKIGVSVYGTEEIEALHSRFPVDVVQAPLNIVDRRFADSGWIGKLHNAGIEVQVRSVFLQGLLLMETRPAYFERWRDLWGSWRAWLDERALTPLEACLRYIASIPDIDRIVVGVDSRTQLMQIIATFDTRPLESPTELARGDLDLIDPSRWPICG